MDDRKKRTVITAVALGQLIAAVGLMVYGTLAKSMTNAQSNVLIGVSLLIYWALTDIAEPIWLKRFEGITEQQKSAYFKFLLFDFAGLAGIAYFLFGLGSNGNSGILGAVVYAVSIKIKRDNQDIFYGIVTPEGKDDEFLEEETEKEDMPEEETGKDENAVQGGDTELSASDARTEENQE